MRAKCREFESGQIQRIERYEKFVKKIQEQVKSYAGQTLQFIRSSTNATRNIDTDVFGKKIELRPLINVLRINKDEKGWWAWVESGTPMDELVRVAGHYNLVPPLVMEYPGITVGGAIQGGALESSSFRYGQFNDICLAYEAITCDGSRHLLSPDNKLTKGVFQEFSATDNSDLFFGISASYGTLAILTAAKVRLISATKYVKLNFSVFRSLDFSLEFMKQKIEKNNIDYVEGIILSKSKIVIICGKMTSSYSRPIQSFRKAYNPWYIDYVRKVCSYNTGESFSVLVPLVDYLFRTDRGSFWMGEFLVDVLQKKIGWSRRTIKRIFNPVFLTRRLYRFLHHIKTAQTYIIQDVYLPWQNACSYIEQMTARFSIYPIWLCPVKSEHGEQILSPHHTEKEEKFVLNVGVYGRPQHRGVRHEEDNLFIQELSCNLNGRKMWYAQSYYQEDKFWQGYDRDKYQQLRRNYQAENALPDVYTKIGKNPPIKPDKKKGTKQFISEWLMEKIKGW